MKMKPNTDWTDAMRNALRDAEISPSADGWERLQHRLDEVDPHVSELRVEEPRKSVWRIHGPRIAAAAAAVLIAVVAGELLWRPGEEFGENGAPVVASATVQGESAVDRSRMSGVESGDVVPGEALAQDVSPRTGRSLSVGAENDGEEQSLGERWAKASGWPQEAYESAAQASREVLLARSEPIQAGEETPRREAVERESAPGTAVPAGSEMQGGLETRGKTRGGVEPQSTPQTQEEARSGEETRREAEKRSGKHDRRNVSVTTAAMFEDPFVEKRPRSAKTSLSLFAGGGMTGGSALQDTPMRSYSIVSNDAVSLIGNGNNFSPMQRRDYDESSFRHHLPLSFGLTVRKEFPYGLSLESGVVYTLLRSDVRLRYSSEDVSQKLHFIGIPLRLNWQFVEWGRFSAYIGAGGLAEKCVSAKFGSENVDEDALQWSLLGVIGAQYRLGHAVGLYFEPEASYYLTDTELCTSRSEAPLSLTLRLGVRVLF